MIGRSCFLILAPFALAGADLAGCNKSLPPDEWAFEVRVADAATGYAICGAEVIASCGEYRTWLWGSCGYYFGAYRAGTYTITVRAAGYEDVVKEDVTTVERWSGDERLFDTQLLIVSMERVEG